VEQAFRTYDLSYPFDASSFNNYYYKILRNTVLKKLNCINIVKIASVKYVVGDCDDDECKNEYVCMRV